MSSKVCVFSGTKINFSATKNTDFDPNVHHRLGYTISLRLR